MESSTSNLAPRRSTSGFALIITLIMVALAAVVSIAFISSTSIERVTASSFNKRARAEMAAQSGLAAALNQLGGVNDFRFVTAVGDDGKPALIPLMPPIAANGVVALDVAAKRLLYSDSPTPAILTLSTTTTPKTVRNAGYIGIADAAGAETERYAFYVDEAGSRQNLGVQGGSNRLYARDPSELPIVTAAVPPAAMNPGQIMAVKDHRGLLFTPMTANPVLSDVGAAIAPPADNYSYATASAITNLNPEGKPRVDLTKLKTYVDGLAVDQGAGNPRSSLVDQLLTPGEAGTHWGGGNLSILKKLGRYSDTQAKQIVANLIDYLDEDLIPTTDDVDNPTYFGVEAKANADGTVVGHPYVNFVGTGLIFNRSGASGNIGGLNSTRIVLVLGLVNPWTSQTKDWDVFYVEPELEIHITGTAAGGTLGPNASDYFQETFSSSSFDPNGNPQKLFPVKNIPPNTGYSFPIRMSGITNYATFKNLLGTTSGGRGQPPGMVFTNLGFQIKKLRLRYHPNAGASYVVQVLDHLTPDPANPQPANPATIGPAEFLTNQPQAALVYKFAIGANQSPGAPNKTDFHLNGDARLNFLRKNPQNPAEEWWVLSRSTEAGTAPPSPQTPVNVFTSHDPNNWDFTGAAPSATTHLWYQQADVTAEFYVKSPVAGGNPKLDSAGEVGYLHTGIPWETLRLYVAGGEAAGKERDKELLAYVHSGTFDNPNYGTVATHPGQAAPAAPIPLVKGPINLNTNKRPTLQSLFLGASALLDADATARASGIANDPDASAIADGLGTNFAIAQPASALPLPGDFLNLPATRTVTSAAAKDFDREVLARRSANVLGTQSTRFTVYALGEARDTVGAATVTTSTVNLRAEVELQTDAAGKPFPKVVSTAYYLTN